MLHRPYKVYNVINKTTNCTNEEDVWKTLNNIAATNKPAFNKTEVYEPGKGWIFAKDWLKYKNLKIENKKMN